MENESENKAQTLAEIRLYSVIVCRAPFRLQFHRTVCPGSQRITGSLPARHAEGKPPSGPRATYLLWASVWVMSILRCLVLIMQFHKRRRELLLITAHSYVGKQDTSHGQVFFFLDNQNVETLTRLFPHCLRSYLHET